MPNASTENKYKLEHPGQQKSAVTTPTVSVILPTYNRVQTLARAIRSVLAQTHQNLELIVVDDGSDDGTAELLESLTDDRMRVIKTSGRIGAGPARNLGAQSARGDFLAFQDSDDEWLTDKLRLQLAAFDNSGAALVCCAYAILPKAGKPIFVARKAWMLAQAWSINKLYEFHFIAPTWLIQRSVFVELGGFDEELPNLEDWELAIRVFYAGRITVCESPLVIKHAMDDGLNRVPTFRVESLSRIINKHVQALRGAPKVHARLRVELAHLLLAKGDMAAAREQLGEAINLQPCKLKYRLLWLASLLGKSIYHALRRLR